MRSLWRRIVPGPLHETPRRRHHALYINPLCAFLVCCSHKPTKPFLGETVFVHSAALTADVISGSVRDFIAGWAAGATRSFALLVQPVRMVRLEDALLDLPTEIQVGDAGGTAASAATPLQPPLPLPAPTLPLTASRLQELLRDASACYSRVALMQSQLAADAAATATSTLAANSCGGGGSHQDVTQRPGGKTQECIPTGSLSYSLVGDSASSGGVILESGEVTRAPAIPVPAARVSIVTLNSWCRMRRQQSHVWGQKHTERNGPSGGEVMPTEASVAAVMVTSQPVWFVHDETGSTAGAVRALAELLQLPAYGINMPEASMTEAATTTVTTNSAIVPGASSSSSSPASAALSSAPAPPATVTFVRLEEEYAAAVLAAQPHGPYCLAATSPYGCMLAFASAVILEQQGHDVMLVLLDGPPCPPAAGLVDPVYCSIYQTLVLQAIRDAGSADAAAAAPPPLPDLATFVATLQSRGAVPDDASSVLLASASFRPPSLTVDEWSTAVLGAVCRAGEYQHLHLNLQWTVTYSTSINDKCLHAIIIQLYLRVT